MKNSGLVKTVAIILITVLVGSVIFTGCAKNEAEDVTESKVSEPVSDAEILIPTEESDGQEDEVPENIPDELESEEDKLTREQLNSIAMLNYLAVLTQEINSSKNSRLFLEEAYASLISNTDPEHVDETTQSHLASLLDIIESYRMSSVKRDRILFEYNQNMADAFWDALPEADEILNIVLSGKIADVALSFAHAGLEIYTDYKDAKDAAGMQYLYDGWELDDEEAATLHDSRKRAFMFMIDIVQENNLPGNLALSESAIEKFVTWENNENTIQKIQFFESESETYKDFGLYWLELAKCYYDNGDYEKCLDAVNTYEGMQADIFRKDYEFAKTIPDAIGSAKETMDEGEYVKSAERYLDILLKNTESSDWSLRTFAAEIYLDLYAITNSSDYLDKAYDITLNNVNELLEEQRKQNRQYLDSVSEVSVPEAAEKDEKNIIKSFNKFLQERRKTELAPVYEPLVLNLELLFDIAEEKGIAESEKNRIEGILRGENICAFLSEELENKYSFSGSDTIKIEGSYDKNELTIPASCVSANTRIVVKVTDNGKTSTYDDWTVKKVDRPSNDLKDFTVTYTSEAAKDQTWSEKSTVNVSITDDTGAVSVTQSISFKVIEYKHYPLVPDTVKFEQVKK